MIATILAILLRILTILPVDMAQLRVRTTPPQFALFTGSANLTAAAEGDRVGDDNMAREETANPLQAAGNPPHGWDAA